MTDQEFWTWFLRKKPELEKFIDSPMDDYTPYHELVAQLKSYNDLLVAELAKNADNAYILILTCDGVQRGIPFVEELYHAAPAMNQWKVQKFRAPGHIKDVSYQGLKLKPSEILVMYEPAGEWYDLELFIKGYKDDDPRYKELAFLYLDHLVGEYNVMTRIGQITFKKLGLLTRKKDKVTLQDLRVAIERLN